MPTLDISRTYNTAEVLDEVDLDNIVDGIETFVNTTKLDDDNIQDDGITASDKLVDDSVTGDKLHTNVADASTIELSSNALQVKDAGITAAKLATNAVTTVKITAANVTRAKLEAVGQQSANQTTNPQTTTSTTLADVTGLSVSITTSGRPVVICLQSTNNEDSYISIVAAAVGTYYTKVALLRDGTLLKALNCGSAYGNASAATRHALGQMWIDPVSAGTYTYKIQIAMSTAATSAAISNAQLVAYEL